MNGHRNVVRRRDRVVATVVLAASLTGCWFDDGPGATSDTTVEVASEAVALPTPTVAPSPPLWAEPGSDGLPEATVAALQAALDAWIASGALAGATAAVVTPEGTWAGAAGVDGAGDALVANAAMPLLGVSTTFTAAEVLLLSARGLVNLDAAVTDYVEVPFETGGATVRQLLSMQAGLPGISPIDMATIVGVDLERRWTIAEALAAIPAEAERYGTLGGAPSYNEVNGLVLAAMIESVTGSTYAEAIRDDLLEPAGLEHTWVQPGQMPKAPHVVGGETPNDVVVDRDSPWTPSMSFASSAQGSGSIAADALDAARWAYLLYGGHVVDSTLAQAMVADPQLEPVLGAYGLGTMIVDNGPGGRMLGHAGGGTEVPFTTVMNVYVGATPVSIAILAPEAADYGTQLVGLYLNLYIAATT